jgi:site-specific DNA recombinase
MQVVGYARVSTEEQAWDRVSLDAQEGKIQAYAHVKDWTLTEIIREVGHSAKSLKRPGMARVLALVAAGM